MNRLEIEKLLLFREPFLMIDEVIVEEKGKKGKGSKNLTGQEYFFEGHFPERPVMPGVLIVEAIAQTSMVVAARGDLKLKGVKKVKFRQTIGPHDILKINVELIKETEKEYIFQGKVYVDENLAASGVILLQKPKGHY